MSTVPADKLEGELNGVMSPKSQDGNAAYATDVTHPELEAHMAKYDVNGDGVFSAEEVRNIVRDLEDTEEKAKNMGRLALAVTVGGLALCLALVGLMYAANEASKESHTEGGVEVDLSGNAVQTDNLKSFASIADFPTLEASQLNKIKYISFAASKDSKQYDMRYGIVSWTKERTSKKVNLFTPDGAIVEIEGDGSAAKLKKVMIESGTETPLVFDIDISTNAARRRLTAGDNSCTGRTFRSIEALHMCHYGEEEGRRLADQNPDAYSELELPETAAGSTFDLCLACEFLFNKYDPAPATPTVLQTADPYTGHMTNTSFYHMEGLKGAAPGEIGTVRGLITDTHGESFCYEVAYFTDANVCRDGVSAGTPCANLNSPEELYCNPNIADNACATCLPGGESASVSEYRRRLAANDRKHLPEKQLRTPPVIRSKETRRKLQDDPVCPGTGAAATCCDVDGSCTDGDDDWCCGGIFYCSNDGEDYATAMGGVLCPVDDPYASTFDDVVGTCGNSGFAGNRRLSDGGAGFNVSGVFNYNNPATSYPTKAPTSPAIDDDYVAAGGQYPTQFPTMPPTMPMDHCHTMGGSMTNFSSGMPIEITPTCYCDATCGTRNDCCDDFKEICVDTNEVIPQVPCFSDENGTAFAGCFDVCLDDSATFLCDDHTKDGVCDGHTSCGVDEVACCSDPTVLHDSSIECRSWSCKPMWQSSAVQMSNESFTFVADVEPQYDYEVFNEDADYESQCAGCIYGPGGSDDGSDDQPADSDTGYTPDHYTFKLMWTCKVAGGCEESATVSYSHNVYAQSAEGYSLYFPVSDVYWEWSPSDRRLTPAANKATAEKVRSLREDPAERRKLYFFDAQPFDGNTYARAVHLQTGHNEIELYGDLVEGMGNFTLGLYKAWDGVIEPVLNDNGNPIVSDFGGATVNDGGWALQKTWEFMIPEEGTNGEHYMVPLGMCGNDQCQDCATMFVNQYGCDAQMIDNEMQSLNSIDWNGDDIKEIYSWTDTTRDVYTCDVCSDCLMDGGLTGLASGNCTTTFTMAPTGRPTSAPTDDPTNMPTNMPTTGATLVSYTVAVEGGYYPYEVSWSIVGPDADPTEVSFSNMDVGPLGDQEPRYTDVLLQPDEVYSLDMVDSFGDGWNGATWEIYDSNNALVAGPFGSTFITGSFAAATFTTADPTENPTSAPTDAPTDMPTGPPTDMPTPSANSEMYSVVMDPGSWPSEITWSLAGPNVDSSATYTTDGAQIALERNEQYTLSMVDSFGDGWNGATWELYDSNSALVAGPLGTTFTDGFADSETFTTA